MDQQMEREKKSLRGKIVTYVITCVFISETDKKKKHFAAMSINLLKVLHMSTESTESLLPIMDSVVPLSVKKTTQNVPPLPVHLSSQASVGLTLVGSRQA